MANSMVRTTASVPTRIPVQFLGEGGGGSKSAKPPASGPRCTYWGVDAYGSWEARCRRSMNWLCVGAAGDEEMLPFCIAATGWESGSDKEFLASDPADLTNRRSQRGRPRTSWEGPRA